LSGKPRWEVEGRDWPNRAASAFVQAGGLRWHVQRAGHGPALLLLHGTGAATHSWRGLLPLLARRFHVVAPDLPGHGFTSTPEGDGLSLPGMARAVAALLDALGVAPGVAVGHSAGAAVMARLALDRRIGAAPLVSLNGALLPLHGLAGMVFSPAAKLLALTDVFPRLFAWRATLDPRMVEQLLRDTGSRLDAEGIELYRRLARCSGHVAGALGMMARWDLEPLARALPALGSRLVVVSATGDRTVPPSLGDQVVARVPGARRHLLPGLGHLAHEEDPGSVEALIEGLCGPADSNTRADVVVDRGVN
jgi:magnesium chelatase accessory protein